MVLGNDQLARALMRESKSSMERPLRRILRFIVETNLISGNVPSASARKTIQLTETPAGMSTICLVVFAAAPVSPSRDIRSCRD